MRRFSLFRRGRVWYVRLHNPKTKRYTSARSTGEVQKNAALLVVAEWMRDGIPDPKRKGAHPISRVFELHTVLSALRALPLSTADAEKVLGILRDRQLVETTVVNAGSGSEALASFL